MDLRYLQIFLGFLGRQHCRFDAEQFQKLIVSISDGPKPPDAGFFELFPEFLPWREKPLQWWQRGTEELARQAERGLQFVLLGEDSYPPLLMQLPDPPWVLTLKGEARALYSPCLSVVGAREPRLESLQWMDENLSALLHCLPFTIASGGARGVDQAAHRIALRNARPTLVFLPSGISELYPKDLADWILPVCEAGGAIVSEFHPRTPMRKWNFQLRNRLIAGVSPATLVIEARARSGTSLTARLARESGRAVGCLPAGAWDTSFSGNLELLRDGAQLINDAQDLVMFLSSQLTGSFQASLGIEGSQQTTH